MRCETPGTNHTFKNGTLVTTIVREIQERSVTIMEHFEDGTVSCIYRADGHSSVIPVVNEYLSVSSYKSWAESVWLGGEVNWTAKVENGVEYHESGVFLTANGGVRFTPEELDVIRKHRK